ncbi:hypothetical protein [Burkholderia vietnamiensis]|uniref:hypothetical protein n=1 Tax=Burkholderia vietnamiensis TaxID=60552 RepID=UPI001B8E7880|nr:hypothetical protein [Burkholderia vietnamiensis]MBR8036668.1 hypothetical protein [Burkholderia vietnamiensis]
MLGAQDEGPGESISRPFVQYGAAAGIKQILKSIVSQGRASAQQIAMPPKVPPNPAETLVRSHFFLRQTVGPNANELNFT